MNARHGISHRQWEQIKELLPRERHRIGRPSEHSNRKMLHGILWILGTGAPWRDLPKRYGPWQTVYSRFRRWTQRGIWDQVFQAVSQDPDTESWLIDATIVRAHQDATGAKKGTLKRLGSAEGGPAPNSTSSSMR